jgi:hypothetical protein
MDICEEDLDVAACRKELRKLEDRYELQHTPLATHTTVSRGMNIRNRNAAFLLLQYPSKPSNARASSKPPP